MFFLRLIILALCFVACDKPKKETALTGVETIIIEPKTIPIEYEFVGVCQSSHLVEIRSRVEGYLDEVSYVEGGFVKEGDLLFKIDPREFQARLSEVQANLDKEKAILWSAQKAVERYKPLYEQKAASRKDWEDATSQLLAQQATVSFYEAKLQEANLNLSYTEITSPISGLTTNSRYQQGTLINPGTSDLLTTVSVIDPIWVVVNVSDYYFLETSQDIADGTMTVPPNYNFDVTLILGDGSKYKHPGKVSFISPVLNSNTGTLSARGVFPNPDSTLKPGQFVRANIAGATRPNAITVPKSAVVQKQNSKFVYVVTAGSKVEKREVVVGPWYNEDWIIRKGLKKGDEVIVIGVNKVQDGMIVNILNGSKKNQG